MGDGKFRVSYIPDVVGDYVLDGYVEGRQVEGCPYVVTFAGNAAKDRLDPTRSIAYGPGLHDYPFGEVGTFVVETRNENDEPLSKGGEKCKVEVKGPGGKKLTANIRDNGNGTFDVNYTAEDPGTHMVYVSFDGEAILRSPFKLNVREPPEEPLQEDEEEFLEEVVIPTKKVPLEYQAKISGAGAQRCIVGTESQFLVETFDENGDPAKLDDQKKLKIKLKGPNGNIPYRIEEKDDNAYVVKYQCDLLGDIEFEVEVDEKIVRGIPRTILAERDAIAYGPGLDNPTCDGPQAFIVETFGPDAKRRIPLPSDKVTASVKGPDGPVNCTVKNNQDGTYTVEYTPTRPGPHAIDAKFNDRELVNFPMTVDVASTNLLFSIGGQGAQYAHVSEPAKFHVEITDPDTSFKAKLHNPNRLKIEVLDPTGRSVPTTSSTRQDGTVDVQYTPNTVGDHKIHVKLDGEDIEGSPLKVSVKEKEKDLPPVIIPVIAPVQPYQRSNRATERAVLEVVQRQSTLDEDELIFDEEETAEEIARSKKSQADPAATLVNGPGVFGAIAGKPAKLEVQLRDVYLNSLLSSDEDELVVRVRDPSGKQIPVTLVNRGDGTYHAEYDPQVPGDYTVDVDLNGDPITNTPFRVPVVAPKYDVVCKGPGLESPVQTDLPTTFEVTITDPKDKSPARNIDINALKVEIQGPHGNIDARLEKTDKDGVFLVGYTPVTIGEHQIDVRLNGTSAPGAPFSVMADTKVEAATSVAYGPGLEGAKHPFFFVEARDHQGRRVALPQDDLEVDVVATPNKAGGSTVHLGTSVKDKGNGAFHCEYAPPPPGSECLINVKINGQHIAKSPFKYTVPEPTTKLGAQGPGVTGGRITPNAVFTVEGNDIASGVRVKLDPSKLKVVVIPPNGSPNQNIVNVEPKDDNTFGCNYNATKLGEYQVDVQYDGTSIPSFPRVVVFTAKQGANNPSASVIKVDQNLQLQKEDDLHLPEGLKAVMFGLGWSYKEGESDLDASVVMVRYDKKLDHSFFKDKKSLDGSVVHSGDERSGGDGTKDDEQINVDLTKVDLKINNLIFVVNVYDKDKTFSSIKNAYVRLTNQKTGKELCRFTLTDCGNRTCMIMCKIYRFGPSQWKLKIIGESGDGNVFNKAIKDIEKFYDAPPPVRTFEVRVHEAKDLPRYTQNNVINPYAVVQFDDKKEKSKVVKASTNPIFEQLFKVKGQGTLIEVNIYDKKGVTHHLTPLHNTEKDIFLGRVNIPVPVQNGKFSFGPQWLGLLHDAGTPAQTGQVRVTVSQIL
eukprot:TRINITY_DN14864_c0_g1_i1.p1 TRINITY_DN14864_c0_g1~~TRINITY_DN14864_c0_g1_i1.p1  ORF type:complete len:1402 (+),score=378.55 TRINITY_DN14864_c0_g1_i1:365-4207(+)